MKKTHILAVILLFCSVGVAQSKKPKFDPEKLLTPAEAAAILGAPVKRAPDTPGVTLQYVEDTERLMTKSLSIQVHWVLPFMSYVPPLAVNCFM